jgi:hypothetical protein
MATDSRTLKLAILGEVKDLSASLTKGSNEVNSFGDKITKFGKVAGAAFAAAGIAATGFAVKFGKDAVMAASDLNETISKTAVLFGDSAQEVEKFADTAASKLGQSKQQALDAAATFATFGKAAGLAGADLVAFSTDFVSLSGDLASFNNTSPEQAINAIGSALRGESEPLRAYGVLLDDASLRQAALSLGIISTTKNALTPQQKVLAAQKLIYEQTSSAQGDFARTSDGLANSQRILTAQFENIKTEIGTALLPIMTELFGFIGTQVIPKIQEFIDSVGGKEGIGNALNNFVTAAKSIFIPVFQGIQFAFNKIKDAVSDNKEEFAALLGFIQKYVAPFLSGVFKIAIQGIGIAISAVVDVVGALIRGFQTLISLGSKIGGAIGGMFGGGRATGGPVAGGTTYLVGEKGPELFTPSGNGTIIPNGAFGGKSSNTINITVNGAIDPISTARQITQILNREATLSGTFNKVGASLLVGA